MRGLGSLFSLLEDLREVGLVKGRAFKEHGSANLFGELVALFLGYWLQASVFEAGKGLGLVAQIQLGAHQDDGGLGVEMGALGMPLLLDVLIGGRGHQRKADDEHISARVAEGSQGVVLVRASSITQAQVDGVAVHYRVGRIIIENSGYIVPREGVCGI